MCGHQTGDFTQETRFDQQIRRFVVRVNVEQRLEAQIELRLEEELLVVVFGA